MKKVVLFLIVLFCGILSSQTSYAINQFYYVTTTEDKEFGSDSHSGDTSGWHSNCLDETIGCSLRQSLYWALQQNNPVTIYLKARGSYCLTHGAIEIVEEDPAEGEERNELDITISGSGGGRKKIGGELEGCTTELTDNIFDVKNGAKLTLKNIQLQGGANSEGGAIYVSNSNLSLENVVIQSNRSGSSTSGGGAVYIKAEGVTSTVTVDESTIKENSAGYKGGGFYVEAANDGNIVLFASNSTFSNNEGGYEGGAIFAQAGTGGSIFLMIVDSSISSNKTTKAETGYGGGGLSLNATDNNDDTFRSTVSAIISRSSIDTNTSANSGGGIKISSEKENKDSVEVSLVNSTISGNIAENDGGGIYTKLDDVRERGDVSISISNSTVVKNVATSGSGGGLKIAEFGWVEVFSSIIAENSASSSSSDDCDIYKTVPASTAIFYSKGHNFIFEDTCSRRQSFDSTDVTDVDPSSGDSGVFSLSVLADNGGPTQTHKVSGTSLEGQGSCASLDVDQRGYYRDTSSCTIGSYEANPSGYCGDDIVQADRGEECDGTSGCSSSCQETSITFDPTGGFGGGGFTGFGGTDGGSSSSGSDSGSSDSGSGSETSGGESTSSSGGGSGSGGASSGSGTSSGGETSSGSGSSSGSSSESGSSAGGSSGSGSSGSGSETGGGAEGGTGPEGDLNDAPASGCSCRLVFDE